MSDYSGEDHNGDDDVQQFATATVRGMTPEGEKAYQGCPDPCSFSVASATTPTTEGKSLLNLTIHCGAPKSGSVFSAKYKFTAGLIHKWSCR